MSRTGDADGAVGLTWLSDDPILAAAVYAYLAAPDWDDLPRLCTTHPVLLDQRADDVLMWNGLSTLAGW